MSIPYANAEVCDSEPKFTNKQLIKILKDAGYGSVKVRPNFKHDVEFMSDGRYYILRSKNGIMMLSHYISTTRSRDSISALTNKWNSSAYGSEAYITGMGDGNEVVYALESYIPFYVCIDKDKVLKFVSRYNSIKTAFVGFMRVEK